jgi:hypothetical protein
MSAITTTIPFWTVPVKIDRVIEASEIRAFNLKKLPENKRYSLESVEYSNGEKTWRATFEGNIFIEFIPKFDEVA